jgi:hypothetical protein
MSRFETKTISATRADCSKIACFMRDQHRQSITMLGLDPYRELVDAFDETPHPMAWVIDGELAALGGVAGPPLLNPIGIVWLAVTEHAVQFRHALVKELRRQLDVAQQVYGILATPLCPADKVSLRFAAFLGFAVELAYLQDGLLIAVYGKKLREAA